MKSFDGPLHQIHGDIYPWRNPGRNLAVTPTVLARVKKIYIFLKNEILLE
jgi:hypothetical protein